MHAALKQLLNPVLRKKLKVQTKFKEVSIDDPTLAQEQDSSNKRSLIYEAASDMRAGTPDHRRTKLQAFDDLEDLEDVVRKPDQRQNITSTRGD